MEVTSIQLIPIRAQQGLIAFAEVILDHCLLVSSIGVHKRLDGKGYRITFPSKKVGERQVFLCHPMTPEFSKQLAQTISSKAVELFDK